MADEPSQSAEQVRGAEVIGALCLATDLGTGFPFEQTDGVVESSPGLYSSASRFSTRSRRC